MPPGPGGFPGLVLRPMVQRPCPATGALLVVVKGHANQRWDYRCAAHADPVAAPPKRSNQAYITLELPVKRLAGGSPGADKPTPGLTKGGEKSTSGHGKAGNTSNV